MTTRSVRPSVARPAAVPLPRTDDAEAEQWADRSDSDLLVGCRRGDAQAWSALVGRYERLIFSVALHNGVDRDDATEITQSSFAALLESIDRIRSDDSLPFWLMTVTRRLAWRVRRRRDREVPLEMLPDGPTEVGPDWESVADLHAALARLPEPCRTVITALYFDADTPSYADLGAQLGRSSAGIGPLRGRCLARLRALMGEAGAER